MRYLFFALFRQKPLGKQSSGGLAHHLRRAVEAQVPAGAKITHTPVRLLELETRRPEVDPRMLNQGVDDSPIDIVCYGTETKTAFDQRLYRKKTFKSITLRENYYENTKLYTGKHPVL